MHFDFRGEMKNILIKFQYDGENFFGMSKQPDKRTVAGELEKVLTEFLGEDISITASGRTDRGVSAVNQYANFFTNSDFEMSKLPFAINRILADDLKVLEAREVAEDFSARFSAKRKIYEYVIYVSDHILPLNEKNMVRIYKDLDISLMQEARKFIIGEHDFIAFSTKGSNPKTTVRTVNDIEIIKEGNIIRFRVDGNGFLYNMVRIIVGVLVDIGLGKKDENNIKRALENLDRNELGEVMPAKGLKLIDVFY